MRELWKDIQQWQQRRRQLAEEWEFHKDRVARELEEAGLDRSEAREIAEQRLRWRSHYLHDARRETGTDWLGLCKLALPDRISQTAYVLPLAIVALTVAILGVNPHRAPVIEALIDPANFFHEVGPHPRWSPPDCIPRPAVIGNNPATPDPCIQRAPWVKAQPLPAAFGKGCWGFVVLAGTYSLWRNLQGKRGSLRLRAYGLLTLLLMAVLGTVCWLTTMQIYRIVNWRVEAVQLTALVLLALAHFGLAMLGKSLWHRDVFRRCPACLERLRMPVEQGLLESMLLNPQGVELICFAGHGRLTENRWMDDFEQSGSFWDDLARTTKPE